MCMWGTSYYTGSPKSIGPPPPSSSKKMIRIKVAGVTYQLLFFKQAPLFFTPNSEREENCTYGYSLTHESKSPLETDVKFLVFLESKR